MQLRQLQPSSLKQKIQRCEYWLTQAVDSSLLDVVRLAARLECISGFIGNDIASSRPTPFVCLLHRLIQLCPTQELVWEMVTQTGLKYLRILAIALLRVGCSDSLTVHKALDVGFADYRTVRFRSVDGLCRLVAVDEVCDEMVNSNSLCGIPLPVLLSRASVAAMTRELRTWPDHSPAEDLEGAKE